MAFEIRTLKDKEKITEPGFYKISLAVHHGQPCDGISVTSGVLRGMDPEISDPATVWATHKLNPNPWEKKETDALKLGSAMAAMIEGGLAELKRGYMVISASDPRKPSKSQLAAYDEGSATVIATRSVEFWQKVDDDPRYTLTETQLLMILNMSKALGNNSRAKAAMQGTPEITQAWFDDETQLWILARPDVVAFSGAQGEFKKINTAGRQFGKWTCDRRITQFGYDMQMALAVEAFEKLTGEWVPVAGIVFQSDQVPHNCILRGMTEDDLRIGQFRNHRSMRRFRECLDSGFWPGPDDENDIGNYVRPGYQLEKLVEEMTGVTK